MLGAVRCVRLLRRDRRSGLQANLPCVHGLIETTTSTFPIIGVARSGDLGTLRERARLSIAAHGDADPPASARLIERLRYVKGSDEDPATFEALRRELGNARHPLHYLAIPPALFDPVIANSATSGCAAGARVILEKPFGRDC